MGFLFGGVMNKEYNLQYFHNVDEKYTICCDVPSKEEITSKLLKCLTFDYKTFPLHVGIAKCHPDDNYIRKVGKEISSTKLEEIHFLLDKIKFINEDYYCIHLFFQTGKLMTKLQLEVRSDIKKVYFVEFESYNV